MKFQILGQNRDTGARMTLEFEAESKAAAERKASTAGMSVHRVIDITDGHLATSLDPNPRAGRSRGRKMSKLKFLLFLIVLAAIIWLLYPLILKHH